jgi:hypothetical protein
MLCLFCCLFSELGLDGNLSPEKKIWIFFRSDE